MLRSLSWLLVCGCVAVSAVADEPAGDKSAALTGQGPATAAAETADFFKRPAVQSEARVSVVRQGDAEIPLVVVKGTPYEMGRQLGQALKQQITTFLPAALPAICKIGRAHV